MDVVFVDPMSYNNLEIYDKEILSRVDLDLDVLFLCSTLFKSKQIDDANKIKIERIFSYNEKKGILKLFLYIISLKRVWNFVRKEKPKVVHVQWIRIPTLELFFYRRIKNRFNVSVVFTAHNIVPHESKDSVQQQYGKFYRLVDAVIVHDNNSKTIINEKFGIDLSKISVIRHGVLNFPVEQKLIEREIQNIVNEYKISDDSILFSSLGLQSYYKGTDVLMDVWKKHAGFFAQKGCHLVLAGMFNGMEPDSMKGVPNVHVENKFISQERLQAYLSRSNVVLLPYRDISQSGVLLSTIAMKTPFLSSNVGGIAEPFTIADVGWEIAHCDETLLYETMAAIANNPQEALKKKNDNEAAWSLVIEAYSWGSIAAKTSALYKKLLNKKSIEYFVQ